MKDSKLFLIFLVIVISGLFFGALVFSQEERRIGLTISPLNFELTANPGDKLENKVKISNPTESKMSVKMETEDFYAEGEEGHIIVEEREEATYSLKRWVKANPTEFTLKPGASKFVTFTIDVPKNAEPGGKYGSVLAVIKGAEGPKASGATIIQKVGALVL